jgi:hypothetical protein
MPANPSSAAKAVAARPWRRRAGETQAPVQQVGRGRAFGATPNMFRAAIANRNAWDYCLVAHTMLSRKACASAGAMSGA